MIKQYHHRNFLADNQLSPADLPELIRQKIRIFDGVEALLPEVLGEDRVQMQRHLFKIDLELVGDLHAEFFDDDAALAEDPDEAVLERLVKQGRAKGLSRSFLREQGYRGALDQREVAVGKFRLVRRSGWRWVFGVEGG